MLGQFLDRLSQIVGSNLAKGNINARQMLAIERVKFCVVGRAVFRTVPPAPVAAFCSQKRFFRSGERFGGWRTFTAFFVRSLRTCIRFSRVPQKLPSRDVLAMANPNIEIRVNPGSRKNSVVLRNFTRCSDCLTDR